MSSIALFSTNDLTVLFQLPFSFIYSTFRKRFSISVILKYSFIPLFGNFNGENGKFIPLFGSLSGREWNGYEGTFISFYFLKISNFYSPRNWEEWEGMKLDLMIFLLKFPKYPYIFNHLF